MQLTDNFSLDELVSSDIIETVGERAADFLHPELAPTLQKLRNRFGSIIVNGTFRGKIFNNSGLRHPKSSIGATLSAHRFGTAADCKFYEYAPVEIMRYITNHAGEFPHITRMENAEITQTWLHIEVGERRGHIYIFNP